MIDQNSFVSMPRVTNRYETAQSDFKKTFWKWFDFSLIICCKQTKSYFLEVNDLSDKFHTFLPGSGNWAWAHSAFYHSASNCVTRFSFGDSGFTSDTHGVLPKLDHFYVALLYGDWAGLCSGTDMYIHHVVTCLMLSWKEQLWTKIWAAWRMRSYLFLFITNPNLQHSKYLS